MKTNNAVLMGYMYVHFKKAHMYLQWDHVFIRSISLASAYRPINLSELENVVDNMHQDSNLAFSQQYLVRFKQAFGFCILPLTKISKDTV